MSNATSCTSAVPLSWRALLGLAAVLVLVCTPRFNQYDWGVERFTGDGPHTYAVGGRTVQLSDAYRYAMHAHYFDGGSADELRAPFTYRPLVPFVASLLPLDPLTGINVINLLLLAAGGLAVVRTAQHLGYGPRWQAVGGGLFAVAFPTFYYGTIGYLDASLVGLLAVGMLLIVREQWLLLTLLLAAGALVKETIVLLLPVTGVYALLSGRSRTALFGWGTAMTAAVILGAAVGRLTSPVDATTFWMPSAYSFWHDLLRPRTYLSFLLTFGLPGTLALPSIVRVLRCLPTRPPPVVGALVTGVFVSLLLFGYAFLTAAADGRFVWTMYPFAIPLALWTLRRRIDPQTP